MQLSVACRTSNKLQNTIERLERDITDNDNQFVHNAQLGRTVMLTGAAPSVKQLKGAPLPPLTISYAAKKEVEERRHA
ncbi:hypothetical protein J6590_084846 [Homalodisca vitripennis]|nr:hypothetical protein J6590_084846 [Homalodisca vitripennis]